MTATAISSPDPSESESTNGNPLSPMKVSDDEETASATVFSGSSQLSDPMSDPMTNSPDQEEERLEMLQEESSSRTTDCDGKRSVAEEVLAEDLNTADSTPTTPDRSSCQEEASSPVMSPPSTESFQQQRIKTPVQHHLSIDHAGNLSSKKRDSFSRLQDPGLDYPQKKTSSVAPSPARKTAIGWLAGINPPDNSEEESKECSKAVEEQSKGYSEFQDEVATIPETPTKSEDGRPETPKNLKRRKLLEDEPDLLQTMSNNQLSAMFACLVVCLVGVVMFLIYVATQPEIVPPTSSPTLSQFPSMSPSTSPTDYLPSASPSAAPSMETASPSDLPSMAPSSAPSSNPSSLPTPSPSDLPSSRPTERDPAEDLSFLIGTVSSSLKSRIQNDLSSKQRDAFEWLIRDPDFYDYPERKLLQRYILALFSLEVKVRPPGLRRRLNWNALETWMQYTDECTWFTSYYNDRVGCDRTGTWKRLVLYNVDLQGTIPSELALLTKMETLILANNTLSGTIPPQLQRIALLKKLDLSGNRLRGMIPTQLANLQRLEELYLQRNSFGNTIPVQFQRLSTLRRLDLSENAIIGRLPTQLGRLQSLEELRVEKNRIGNSIPPEFANLKTLRVLDASHNGILGGLSTNLGSMLALRELDLSHNAITGTLPTEIGSIVSLDLLNLGYNRLMGTVPLHLGLYGLQHIDLSNNQFIGTLPARLGGLRDLVYLDISGNPMSGPFPSEVCNLRKEQSMFKANCAFVGCTCCTHCV